MYSFPEMEACFPNIHRHRLLSKGLTAIQNCFVSSWLNMVWAYADFIRNFTKNKFANETVKA